MFCASRTVCRTCSWTAITPFACNRRQFVRVVFPSAGQLVDLPKTIDQDLDSLVSEDVEPLAELPLVRSAWTLVLSQNQNSCPWRSRYRPFPSPSQQPGAPWISQSAKAVEPREPNCPRDPPYAPHRVLQWLRTRSGHQGKSTQKSRKRSRDIIGKQWVHGV